ncbi:MAG: GlsB/YeaQ/YmgE family stress response membrane protein [Acidobacteria bacterium]|nr:GlsB/YeaQ/YmgE family stress response membrane protein [Acidobacteriota bacterium]
MGWIAWIFFGLIAGALAKAIMPGRDPGGWIITMLLGIAGAVVGGWIGNVLWGSTGVSGFNISSLALAIFGAVVLLAIYNAIRGRRRTTASEDETTRRAA